MKRFVNVQNSLDVVIAGRKLIETDERIAKRGGIDDGGRAGPPIVYIEAEELRTRGFLFTKLKAWLGGLVGGDAQKDVAVKRLGAKGAEERNLEAESGGWFGRSRLSEGAGGSEKANAEQ